MGNVDNGRGNAYVGATLLNPNIALKIKFINYLINFELFY